MLRNKLAPARKRFFPPFISSMVQLNTPRSKENNSVHCVNVIVAFRTYRTPMKWTEIYIAWAENFHFLNVSNEKMDQTKWNGKDDWLYATIAILKREKEMERKREKKSWQLEDMSLKICRKFGFLSENLQVIDNIIIHIPILFYFVFFISSL